LDVAGEEELHLIDRPNSKIILYSKSYVAIPSEYFQIITAGIYSIALFYTVVAFQRTKRLDQITSLKVVMSDLRDLDRELAKIPSGSQYDDVRSPWYSRIFNTLKLPFISDQ